MKLTLKPGRRLRHYVARHSSAGWNPVKNKKILFVYGLLFLPLLAIGGSSYALFLSGGNGPAASINSVNLQKGLVGWWQMNGNAKDSTPYGNNGTVNGATPTADRKGKANSAYSFNGTSNVINMGNGSVLTMGTSDWSIGAWVKTTNASGTIFSKRTGGPQMGYTLQVSGGVVYARFDSSTSGTYVGVTGTTIVTDGTWHYLAATFQRNGNLTVYVDGIAQASASIAAYSSNNIATVNPLLMGEDTYSHSVYFGGSIDDARVYNRAISAAEVTALYNEYDPGVKAASGENGLVGWWKLNGNAKDSSPYGDNGIVNGTTSTTGPNGQLNGAMSFNGTASDYISVNGVNPMIMGGGSYFSSSWTLSIWTKGANPSGSGLLLGRKGDNTGILQQGNNYDFVLWQAAGQEKSIVYTESNFSAWHLLTAVYSDGNMSFYVDGNLVGTNTLTAIQTLYDPIYIGGYGAATWSGQTSLSDARTYNRALSSSEVSNLYNSYNSQVSVSNLQSGLVGDWAFNGNAKDSTPYSDNGTVNGATLTTDRKGRTNSAYAFNGSSSYVDVPNAAILSPASAMSLSAWVYPTTCANYPGVISKGYAVAGGYSLQIRTNCTLWWELDGADSTRYFYNPTNIVLPLNSWSHLAATYDGSVLRIYVNGVQDGTGSNHSFTIGTITTDVLIGKLPGFGTLNGSIDDVRIYNRALSAAEVTALYQEYN